MDEIAAVPSLLSALGARAQRGSKPRCHLLTHGTPNEVSRRLSSLMGPRGRVCPSDKWMPVGFSDPEEAQLHKAERLIPSEADREALTAWWLADPRPTSRTPNWDIASTCSIQGRSGLLLVEAKAHRGELIDAACGKTFDEKSSKDNDDQITSAIEEANRDLARATGFPWRLSRDRCYQMSNRFAWAWKLCTLGYPVVLTYLGFIGAKEMPLPFERDGDWYRLVEEHSTSLFPADVWGRIIDIDGVPLLPLMRVSHRGLPAQYQYVPS